MDFRRQCEAELRELLAAVEEKCGRQAADGCLVYVKDITNPQMRAQGYTKMTSEMPVATLDVPLRLTKWFRSAARSLPDDVAALLRLYIYVECIEVRYVYAVVANLLGAYAGERGRPADAVYRSFSAKPCFEKVKEMVEKAAAAGKRFQLVEAWETFLDLRFRNVVGHSDFTLHPGGTVTVVRDLMRRITEGVDTGRGSYPPTLVEQLYDRARDFLMAFPKRARDAMTPLQARVLAWFDAHGVAPPLKGHPSGRARGRTRPPIRRRASVVRDDRSLDYLGLGSHELG
jgi:hypothetical protein